MSCVRGSTATGSSGNVHPRRMVRSAASAAPGLPSMREYAAVSARRTRTNIAARNANGMASSSQ